MSTFNYMLVTMSILHAQAITVHAFESPSTNKGENLSYPPTLAEGGGGVNIGAVIGAIAGVVLVLAALILLFVKTRNNNRNRAIQSHYPSQKQSIFALGLSKPAPQPLPLYTQPTSPYAQHYNGGLPMPQAVHPSTSGYYRQAEQVQQDDRVRFGSVGVVRY